MFENGMGRCLVLCVLVGWQIASGQNSSFVLFAC
jgi:hypothetical protein